MIFVIRYTVDVDERSCEEVVGESHAMISLRGELTEERDTPLSTGRLKVPQIRNEPCYRHQQSA